MDHYSGLRAVGYPCPTCISEGQVNQCSPCLILHLANETGRDREVQSWRPPWLDPGCLPQGLGSPLMNDGGTCAPAIPRVFHFQSWALVGIWPWLVTLTPSTNADSTSQQSGGWRRTFCELFLICTSQWACEAVFQIPALQDTEAHSSQGHTT